MAERSQHSNILLAFISLTAVIVIVSLIGFFHWVKVRKSFRGKQKPTNTVYPAKCRDAFWNFV